MRIAYLFLMLFGFGTFCGCATKTELLSHTFILPVSTGQELLKQCSRNAPVGVSDFWSPSPEEVNYADRNIAGYFETIKSKQSGETPDADLYRFHRQYLGIVQNGKRLIYGNFYYVDPKYPEDYKDEAVKPQIICDGGNYFFGLVYDPVEHQFLNIQFNGPF